MTEQFRVFTEVGSGNGYGADLLHTNDVDNGLSLGAGCSGDEDYSTQEDIDNGKISYYAVCRCVITSLVWELSL